MLMWTCVYKFYMEYVFTSLRYIPRSGVTNLHITLYMSFGGALRNYSFTYIIWLDSDCSYEVVIDILILHLRKLRFWEFNNLCSFTEQMSGTEGPQVLHALCMSRQLLRILRNFFTVETCSLNQFCRKFEDRDFQRQWVLSVTRVYHNHIPG
jgi:hypothetical protein